LNYIGKKTVREAKPRNRKRASTGYRLFTIRGKVLVSTRSAAINPHLLAWFYGFLKA
jgi:hypothetical protein